MGYFCDLCRMDKAQNDRRRQKYASALHSLNTGFFKSISELIEAAGITAISEDMPLAHKALLPRTLNPGKFKAEEIARIAEIIGAEPEKVAALIFMEMREKRERKVKKR